MPTLIQSDPKNVIQTKNFHEDSQRIIFQHLIGHGVHISYTFFAPVTANTFSGFTGCQPTICASVGHQICVKAIGKIYCLINLFKNSQ